MKRHLEISSSDDEPAKNETDYPKGNSSGSLGIILEQDRFLPIANISRIMKKVLPLEAKLSKEAKECVQECMTEFLLFITSEASEKCSNERRKTITGEDLIDAFKTLGFDNYVAPLEIFMKKYREANRIHTGSLKPELSQTCSSVKDRKNANPVAVANNAQEETAPPNGDTLQPMQMFYDASKKQYFIAAQQSDGTQSLVQVDLTPIGNCHPLPGLKKEIG